MDKRIKKETGLLSLEASISLTIFIFLMLFFYSFFIVFETRNVMAHTLLATADSLSLDPHEAKVLGESRGLSEVIYNLYGMLVNSGNGFVSTDNWSSNTELDNEEQITELGNLVKQRFVAYLSGGDETKADNLLADRYHIVGGLSGLDFSGTKIADGKLHISVKYTLEYEFQVFGKGNLKLEQACCSKLWE